MKPKMIIGLALTGVLAVFAFTIITMYFSTRNREVNLRTTVQAQEKKCEAYFDKMWKILQQKAGVADQYKEAFKSIYPDMIAGRYSKGDGSLMKWVTESNPTFDASMYKDLMQSIEIERTGFFNEQATLIDMNRERTAMLEIVPDKWFLSDTLKPLNIKVITSIKTDSTYATGHEDDVELFKK